MSRRCAAPPTPPAQALEPDDGAGAGELLAAGGAALDGVCGVDAGLDALAERWRGLLYEANDLAAELRGYAEGLDAEPGALAGRRGAARRDRSPEAQARRLDRRRAGVRRAVPPAPRRARERRGGDRAGAARASPRRRRRGSGSPPSSTTPARRRRRGSRAPSPRGSPTWRWRARRFEVALSAREPGPSGADAVEFLLAPNSGVPAGPVRETASGGELSRVMLALLGVANDGSGATLVFDEVDAGIGGQTARAVGARLRELAGGRQVLCITHLPQIASLADRHFSIAKDARAEPALTTVTQLADREVVGEIVRMLGADADDVAARRHARELLKAA